jgi:hypothetical protein
MKKQHGTEFGFLLKIAAIDADQRSSDEEFYLRMFLKCEVPFFYDYDRHTLVSLASSFERVSFGRREIIYAPGQPATKMYVVLSGEVGIFDNAAKTMGSPETLVKVGE